MFKQIKNKLLCKLGFHKWKIIKSIRLSNLIFLIKKHNALLNKTHFELDFDYIVYDKKCKICNKEDFNIDITKDLMTQKIKNTIKI